jgi:predicted MFS family arabinose efflux permease
MGARLYVARLVDALTSSGFTGRLDSVFAKGKIVEGAAMLTGSVAGGYLAQVTNLGVPYLARAVVLVLTLVLAFLLMHDVGFAPKTTDGPVRAIKNVLAGALRYGLRNPPVRWVMLASLFTDGVSIYAFYAMQPYLLQLYGDPTAYGIAGLAAAIVGGAQIGGGILVPRLRRGFDRRTSVLMMAVVVSTFVLAMVALIPQLLAAILLLAVWGLVFATVMPVRQAFINGLIPSEQRATVLSFQSLIGSGGGVVFQPALGRAADAWGYPASYLCSAAIQGLAIPFMWLARRQRAASDSIPAEDAAA